jgi:peroxiredoxin
LLSDADRSVGRSYGVARAPDEKYPDWAKRITFLIDPNGVIAKVYEVTDVATHPDEVLADIRSLSGPE